MTLEKQLKKSNFVVPLYTKLHFYLLVFSFVTKDSFKYNFYLQKLYKHNANSLTRVHS